MSHEREYGPAMAVPQRLGLCKRARKSKEKTISSSWKKREQSVDNVNDDVIVMVVDG